MVSQFVAAPIAWTLRVTQTSDIPALRRGPDNYPIIGWEYFPDGEPAIVVWVSYKGVPTTLTNVLEELRAEVVAEAARIGVQAQGNLSYTLVPA